MAHGNIPADLLALQQDMVGKPPINWINGNAEHRENQEVLDRHVIIIAIPHQGRHFHLFRSKVSAWNVFSVEPGKSYICVLHQHQPYYVKYRDPGLGVGQPMAYVCVIGLEQSNTVFDIPLKPNLTAEILVRLNNTYRLAMYPQETQVLNSASNWRSSPCEIEEQSGLSYSLGMLEWTNVHFTSVASRLVRIYDYSQMTLTQLQQINPLPAIVYLHDSWSADLCGQHTGLNNVQRHFPAIDQNINCVLTANTLERISVFPNTTINISIGEPQNKFIRHVSVTAGRWYILVCNDDDHFVVTCLPDAAAWLPYAIVRVIALHQTPPNFILPMRPNRTVDVIGVHNKRLNIASIGAWDPLNLEEMAQFENEVVEFQQPLYVHQTLMHRLISVTPRTSSDLTVAIMYFAIDNVNNEPPTIQA